MYTHCDNVIKNHTELLRIISDESQELIKELNNEILEKRKKPNNILTLEHCSDIQLEQMIKLAKYFIVIRSADLLVDEKIEKPILSTIRSEHFLTTRKHVLTRNILFIPLLAQMGIWFPKIELATKFETIFPTPLSLILASLNKKERLERYSVFHPASHSNQADITEEDRSENEVWINKNREVLKSYNKLITDFTGQSFSTFNPLILNKVLRLLVTVNQKSFLIVKPLFNSLNTKVHEPLFNSPYDLSYLGKVTEDGDIKSSKLFFDSENEKNPNLSKAILNELLTYLLDASHPVIAADILQLTEKLHKVKKHLQNCSDAAYNNNSLTQWLALQPAAAKLCLQKIKTLSLPKNGEYLYEKIALSMVLKDVVNQFKCEQEVLTKIPQNTDNDILKSQNLIQHNKLIIKILNKEKNKNILGFSKKQTQNSLEHKQIIAILGLHHYLLCSGVIAKKSPVFDPKELNTIAIIIFIESNKKTKIPFKKNLASSDNKGPESTWNSLMDYTNKVVFSTNQEFDSIYQYFMPYMHNIFWIERYKQINAQLNEDCSYDVYIKSRQEVLNHLINFLEK